VESSSTHSKSSANLYLVGVVVGLLAAWALFFLGSALFGFVLLTVVLIGFVAYSSSKNTSLMLIPLWKKHSPAPVM
jgi:methyl-accepting chemotaxis protein